MPHSDVYVNRGRPNKASYFFQCTVGCRPSYEQRSGVDAAHCIRYGRVSLPTRQRYGLAYILVVTSGGPHAVSTLRQAGSACIDEWMHTPDPFTRPHAEMNGLILFMFNNISFPKTDGPTCGHLDAYLCVSTRLFFSKPVLTIPVDRSRHEKPGSNLGSNVSLILTG